MALTTISSLPYTASTTGETYELGRDLTTSGTGISVTADNITIDFKGYELTFGTGNGADVDGVYGSFNIDNLTVYSSVAGGAITHGGTGNPQGVNGVYVEEVNTGLSVHNLTITVNSQAAADMSCGVLAKRARNPEFYNLTIDNNASAVANRHSVPAGGLCVELDTATASTSLSIHDNTISSTHMGMTITGSLSSGGTDFLAGLVHSNTININQVATNAYAIRWRGPDNASIYSNTITTSGNGGRGITLEHADYIDVYSNTITAGESYTPESSWVNLIRMRYGLRYSKVRDNTLSVLCGQSGYKSGRAIYATAVANIDASNPLDVDNQITGNTITVNNQSSSESCRGLQFGSLATGHNLIVTGNDITTNNHAVYFFPDVMNEDVNDLTLSTNKITGVDGSGYGITERSYYATLDSSQGKEVVNLTISSDEYCGTLSRTDLASAGTGTFDYTFTGDSVECAGSPSTETSCTDSVDNDIDGLTDCDDTDCSADTACSAPSTGQPCYSGSQAVYPGSLPVYAP